MEKIDSLNYLSIKILEQLGNKQPSQAEINRMEAILSSKKNDPILQDIWRFGRDSNEKDRLSIFSKILGNLSK